LKNKAISEAAQKMLEPQDKISVWLCKELPAHPCVGSGNFPSSLLGFVIRTLIQKGKPMPRIPVVDQEICIGCENCARICPEVFRMADVPGGHGHDHKSTVHNPFGAPEEKIEKAMDACPVACIYWED
jgi:ferredoxin